MPSDGKSTRPHLQQFLANLEARLRALDPQQVADAIVARARQLRPNERAAFLGIFPLPGQTPAAEEQESEQALVEDARAFAAAMEAGDYYGEPEPDEYEEYGEYGPPGDTAWAEELDELFDRASAEFAAGNRAIAAAAYEALLEALQQADDGQVWLTDQSASGFV
jgi:hypothetical protein